MKLKFGKFVLLAQQILIISLISVVFTEISFRLFNKINPTFIFYDNSYNRFRGKPFASDYDTYLNSKGFKDIEYELVKPEGRFRILGIGDSFAFGIVPYKYNYHTILEEALNRQGKKVEIVNMGIPNLNPKDYFAILMNEGLALKPDMVIVSFFMGNDFLDAKNEKLQRPLHTYSYVLSFAKYVIDLQKKYEGQTFLPENWVYRDDEPTWTYENYLQMEAGRSGIYQKQNAEFQESFNYSINYLKKIKEVCDYKGIPLLVAIIPDEIQLERSLQADVVKLLQAKSEDFDFTLPNRLLAEELNKNQISYIDLLEGFDKESSKTRLYKQNDSHWNIAGNQLAADLLYRHIFEHWNQEK